MPSAHSWPLASHFSTMLQNPRHAFRDADLKQVEVEKDAQRQPRVWSGAFASVYKGSRPNGGGALAIRVFTSAAGERRDRYNAIAAYLQGRTIAPLVGFTYADDGIRSASDGKYYPLVTMDWVPGETLLKWTMRQCHDKNKGALSRAAELWVRTIADLAAAKVAHGDLQHANVMVTGSGELKLVDYDCMCVPALVGRKNLEIGVDPYQHPERNDETLLSLQLDNYSALFILTALRALAAAPDLWQQYVDATQYDKLLFRREDLDDPQTSELMRALKRSSDADVPRFCEELIALRGKHLDQVPGLDEVLFSYGKVESLLAARDFDAAVALLARSGKPASAAPAALQPQLRDARQRVDRLAELNRAVAAGDERAMQRLYDRKLLDDYPKARQAVAVAKLAAQALPVIDELERAHKAHDWRKLVRQWDTHEKLLRGRKSAERFATEAANWRQRNQLCDAVLALLKQPHCDAAALDAVWRQLVALGGHPETTVHRPHIERILQRELAWTSFAAVSRTPSETHDAALIKAWNEPLFAGWKQAEAERPLVAAAAKRLEIVAELERLAAQPAGMSNEEALFHAAAGLPAGYGLRQQPRLKLAHDRLHAMAHLKRALQDPVSDLAVAAAWERLEQVQAQTLASSHVRARALVAVERAAVLHILKQIPHDYPVEQAPQQDPRLLSTWKGSLLAECHDADPWRVTHEKAVARHAALEEMRTAIAAGDKTRVAELAGESCLEGYPLPADWARMAKGALADLRTLRHLLSTLKRKDHAAFREAFDARVLDRHKKDFAPYHALIGQWLAEMLTSHQLGLSPPLARKALVHEPGNNGTYRACWQWPEPRYSDVCYVALCRNQPRRGEDLTGSVIRYRVERKRFEEGGGNHILHVEPEWSGCYVAVWATVNAGFQTFTSEPLILGRIETAAKTKRNGGLFGGWKI